MFDYSTCMGFRLLVLQNSSLALSSPRLSTSLSLGSYFLLSVPPKYPEQGKENNYKMDTMESDCKRACDNFDPKKSVSDHIIPHLLNLYASCATARDFEIYTPNATFEDPLMRAHGVDQIKSAFYSIPKVFSESKIVEYTIKENDISPGTKEILIDSKQHYKLFGKNIDMKSLIKLYVEGGKVVRHEDCWDGKPLQNRETVEMPLIGRALEAARRGSMLVTHAMMGFGKDPTV